MGSVSINPKDPSVGQSDHNLIRIDDNKTVWLLKGKWRGLVDPACVSEPIIGGRSFPENIGPEIEAVEEARLVHDEDAEQVVLFGVREAHARSAYRGREVYM
jgi:hypothetical protein